MTSLTECLELWGFERDLSVFLDGSVGFGLRAVPIDVSTWDNQSRNSFSESLKQFLNGLPLGISLQFVQDIARGNDSILCAHQRLCKDDADEMAKALCDERISRLTRLDQEGGLPRHQLLIFVRCPPSGIGVKRKFLLGRAKKTLLLDEATLQKALKRAEDVKDNIIKGLKALGLETKSLSAEEVTELTYRQWNPGRETSMPAFATEDVRSSLLFTDAAVSETGFSLPPFHHRVISLKIIPDCSMATMAAKLRDLPFDSRLFLTIEVPDQQKEIEALQTQRRMAFAMLHGKRSGVKDLESEAKLQDLEGLLGDMIAQGEKIFHVSLNVLLRSTDEEDLSRKVQEVLAVLRDLGGAEGLVETLAAFDIFCSFALPNARCSERKRRFKTSYLADFLPIYSPWAGHESPSMLLRSRLGSLVALDPFSSLLPNANQIVSGGSGAGKSFTTNILLLHTLKEKPRIFIIDVGGSYRKLCESLGGQYIPISVNGNATINPFDLGNENAPSSSKVKFLLALIEVMTREDGEKRLMKLERSQLEEAIARMYVSGLPRKISSLKQLLMNSSDPGMTRLGQILSTWCGNTPYGQFVDQETTVALERPIICFDLKGLETYPDLQAVCLLLITEFIWNEIQRDKVSKKFVVFDECWRLMENDAGAGFLGEVYRTFRKYYASAIAISQNIDDFAKSRVATAIMPNAAIRWILRQKGADLERLRDVLNLNEREVALVDSLRQERGVFSEGFLMAGDSHSVVAIESTPLEYWIATTDPRDLAVLDEYEKEHAGEARIDILKSLADKFPHGVSAS